MSTYAMAGPSPASSPGSERRAAERVLAAVGVEYAVGDARSRALTADLSESGLFLLTDAVAAVGETVRLTLHLTATVSLRILGTVARAVTDPPLRGIGVVFAGVRKDDESALQAYLRGRKERRESEKRSRYVAPLPSFEMKWIPATPEERIPRSQRRLAAQQAAEALPRENVDGLLEKAVRVGAWLGVIAIPVVALLYLARNLGGVGELFGP